MQKYGEWRSPDNRLLATLPVKEYERLLPHLQPYALAQSEVIQETSDTVDYVYFPNDAVVVLLSTADEEEMIEVGLVGKEGMVGVNVLFGGKRTPGQAVALTPGGAMRLKSDVLRREFKRGGGLQDVLLPYAQAVLTQSAQSASCHRYHSVRERVSRFLLMVHDRAGGDEFRVTHELMSRMLGLRRATVTEAAHEMQRQGLINYSRGRIRVTNRQGLERAACSCYRIIQEGFDSLNYA